MFTKDGFTVFPSPCRCPLYNHVFHLVEKLAPSLLANDKASQGRPFHTQSLHSRQLTGLPLECLKRVFFEHSTVFAAFCCPCPNFFEICCWHQNQNRNTKMTLNIKYSVVVDSVLFIYHSVSTFFE